MPKTPEEVEELARDASERLIRNLAYAAPETWNERIASAMDDLAYRVINRRGRMNARWEASKAIAVVARESVVVFVAIALDRPHMIERSLERLAGKHRRLDKVREGLKTDSTLR